MITVKAFDKRLICKGFKYEVRKTYTIPTKEVEMCERGFHASANCDVSETLNYYPNIERNEYALVDINVVDKTDDKVVGDSITVLKKLENLDELISYDKTGEWCVYFAERVKGANIKKLQDAVIEKDATGEWIYYLIENVKGVNKERLQDAVIAKDKTGLLALFFR